MLVLWLVRGSCSMSRVLRQRAGLEQAKQRDIMLEVSLAAGQPVLLTWSHLCCWRYHRSVQYLCRTYYLLLALVVFVHQAAAKRQGKTTDRRCSGEKCLRACEACS